MLACIALASGAILGMAAQSGLFHLGLDFGRVRDELIVGQIAHPRSALTWWAWWLVPLAAFFIGPVSVALTRWIVANWWLFRAVRLLVSAAIVLALAAVGELPAASSTLDVRSGAVAGMLVAVVSALLAWLGARVIAGAGRPPARIPEQVRARIAVPIAASAPWRGGGSANAGTPFVRMRQRHALVTRFTMVRLALVAGLALVVFAAVAAVSGITVLVEHATPGALSRLVAWNGMPDEPPARAAQIRAMAAAALPNATPPAPAAPAPVARAEPIGIMIAGVLVPESELTFAKGYVQRRAVIAAAIVAAQRESTRIVAAAERAENRLPARLKHVATLRPVRYGHARRHVAYVRHGRRHYRVRREDMGERRQTRHPYRVHDRRHLRGHDRYASEPRYRLARF